MKGLVLQTVLIVSTFSFEEFCDFDDSLLKNGSPGGQNRVIQHKLSTKGACQKHPEGGGPTFFRGGVHTIFTLF